MISNTELGQAKQLSGNHVKGNKCESECGNKHERLMSFGMSHRHFC